MASEHPTWLPGLPDGWDWLTLEAVLDFVVDNRGKTAPTADTGIPLIATNCVKNVGLYPVYEKVRYVPEEAYDSWFRSHPEPGDVLFVNKGTPGCACLVPDPVDFCIAQDMVALRPKPELMTGRYLHAAIRSPVAQHQIRNGSVGTTIPHFKKGDFNKLWLPVPPKDEADAIGDLLFALGSKIELNRKMNRTLEEMAQALFKSWFIDFDGHDDLVDSEQGPVPRGWEVLPISEVVSIKGGSTPSTKKPEFWEGGTIHWTTPKDLSSLSTAVLLDTGRKITDAGLAKISSGLLPQGTLLLSSRAPVGYLAISEVPISVNQGYIAMPPGGRASSLWLLQWAKANMDRIKARAGGTTFAEISKRSFRPIPVVLPPADVLERFDAVAGPLHRRVVTNEMESSTLAELRDTLLPKLISGELRVPEAEDMAEASL